MTTDDSSVSAEFFLGGEELERINLAAHEAVCEAEPESAVPKPSSVTVRPPELSPRQKLTRRLAWVVVASSAALLLASGIKLHGRRPHVQASAPTKPSAVQVAPAASVSVVTPAVVSAAPPPEASASIPSAAPAASASAAPAIPDGVDPKKEALRLLNTGRFKAAIPMAEAAIARDPADAEPYLFLGTALQSTGRWKQAIEAYSQCVHAATRGPVGECRAVGGR